MQQLFLCYSQDFYFTQNVLRQCFYCYARTSGFACEVFSVYFVECSEVAHVSQEACCFYNVCVCQTVNLQNSADVFHNLFCLSNDAFCYNIAYLRSDGELTGTAQDNSNLHSRKVMAEARGGVFWCRQYK